MSQPKTTHRLTIRIGSITGTPYFDGQLHASAVVELQTTTEYPDGRKTDACRYITTLDTVDYSERRIGHETGTAEYTAVADMQRARAGKLIHRELEYVDYPNRDKVDTDGLITAALRKLDRLRIQLAANIADFDAWGA